MKTKASKMFSVGPYAPKAGMISAILRGVFLIGSGFAFFVGGTNAFTRFIT